MPIFIVKILQYQTFLKVKTHILIHLLAHQIQKIKILFLLMKNHFRDLKINLIFFLIIKVLI